MYRILVWQIGMNVMRIMVKSPRLDGIVFECLKLGSEDIIGAILGVEGVTVPFLEHTIALNVVPFGIMLDRSL